jgi:type IV pilus assembly protein PilY1
VDTSRPLVSIATSSSYLRSGLNAYIAGYSSDKYSGSLSARPIDGVTGAIGATEAWSASATLDAVTTANLSNRFVLSYGVDSPASNSTSRGFSWTTYSSLPTAQMTPLNKNSAGTVDNKGQSRVDFIRGDRTKELAQSGGIFRDRDSRFGDVVNSNIWYTGKPASGYSVNNYATFRSTGTGGLGGRAPMVYIGANDGILHGFSAGNWPSDTTITVPGGKELLAYIPQGIAEGNLRKLTDTTYIHQYFVDGTPFTGDAYIGTTPAWKTVLIGTLGAGGKGYFALDVTDPAQFTASNAANLVVTDTTATTDIDLGYIFSPPVMDDAVANKSRQIVKLNGGRWAAVLGNGYNSTNEAPVLIIQYLDGTKAIKKISPCITSATTTSNACSFKGTNGLSTPQLIDLNGDGTVDVAYAGDLKGNLWKFDLSSVTDTDWKVSFSGQPFFVAQPSAGVTLPITAAPFWMPHPLGGIMVAVGTGRNLSDMDQGSVGIDSLFALYDNSTFTTASNVVTITDAAVINTTASTSLPTTLVQQTITATPVLDTGTNYYTSSNNAVDYVGTPAQAGPPAVAAVAAKRGWYLNWPIGGQRVLQNMRAFSGQKILIQSMIPKTGASSNTETCSPSATTERSFQSVLNMFTGAPPVAPAFSFTDPLITAAIGQTITMVEGSAGDTTIIRTDTKIKLLSSNCPVGQVCNSKDFNPGSSVGVRANWRQVQ